MVDTTGAQMNRWQGASSWQLVALLLCLATLESVAAILCPNVFAVPFAQF